ncbi:MAG: hypothetical protein WCW13_03945 [archaeon]|jgi:hypothetical protein
MAFQSLVEDSRKMNAKMIAMGQSIDIQKMPRPKQGSIAMQKATYTPQGSDVEKLLYPKNFKPRAYEPETQQHSQIINATGAAQEEMTEEITQVQEQLQPKETPKIIGDDEGVIFQPKQPTLENTKSFSGPSWQRCKYYKAQGERAFCKEYLGWCAKEKCSRPNF